MPQTHTRAHTHTHAHAHAHNLKQKWAQWPGKSTELRRANNYMPAMGTIIFTYVASGTIFRHAVPEMNNYKSTSFHAFSA